MYGLAGARHHQLLVDRSGEVRRGVEAFLHAADDLGLSNGMRGGGPAEHDRHASDGAQTHQSGSIGGARTSRGRPPSLAVTTPSRSMRSIMRAARL